MCKISIVMPVYNGEKYIKESIDSILGQTLKDFEFIIINDCSTDKTEEIINNYNDKRILLVNNESNLGIANTLNKGINIAKGKYIARMDADDICNFDRLEKQYKFMENNIDIGMCGSHVEVFDEKSSRIHKCPIEHDEIHVLQMFNSPFAHPSVMIRRDVIEKNRLKYNSYYEGMEDYELWINMSKFTKFANINEPLLRYRQHQKQVTKKISEEQMKKSKMIRKKILMELSNDFRDIEIDTFYDYCTNDIFKHENRILDMFEIFEKIIRSNLKSNIYNHKILKQVISHNIYWSLLKYKNIHNKNLNYKKYAYMMDSVTRCKAFIKIR